METVKGGKAGIAIKNGIGRVVKRFPPEVRVSRKDKVRLDAVAAKVNQRAAAKRAARRNGAAAEEAAAVPSAAPDFAPLPVQHLLGEEHIAFFKRVAGDERIPRDIRVEAFSFTLYAPSEE